VFDPAAEVPAPKPASKTPVFVATPSK